MAGVDKDYLGEAKPLDGTRIGYLAQEPQLEAGKTVQEEVEKAVHATRSLVHALRGDRRRSSAKTRPTWTSSSRSTRSSRTRSRPSAAGSSIASSSARWTRSASRRATPIVDKLSGGERRRVALCRLLLVEARHAPPRRADQPPRRRERRLARALPPRLPGHGRRRHPRSLLPRQRRRLDPRARSRRRHSLRGQLHRLARAEEEAPRARAEAGDARKQRTLERELEWVRMAPRARQAKSKARLAAYETLLAEEKNKQVDTNEITIPTGAAPRQHRHRGRAPEEGLRRQAPHRRPLASPSRAAASSASSARTAPARRRSSG